METIFTHNSDHSILTFSGDLNRASLPELINSLKTIEENSDLKALILDLNQVKTIDDSCMSEIVSQSLRLRKRGVNTYGIKISEQLKNKIIQGGLSKSIIPKTSIEECLTDAGLIKKTSSGLNVEFINPFIEGAIEAIRVQAQMEPSAGSPFMRGLGPEIRIDLIASLGLISKTFKGTIALCFPAETFLGIISKMLSQEFTELSEDNADAAGEILNIIFGIAKENLNRKGYGIQQAIPNVIRGTGLELKAMTSEPTIILPISTPAGPFQIHIGLTPQNIEKKGA